MRLKFLYMKGKKTMSFFKNTFTKNGAANTPDTAKTENNICELVFILDRSGSMSGLEKDTIGGFNSLIEKQQKESGECLVTTVLFDHESEMIHDRVDLKKISPMTEKEYFVRGSTALLDAVGQTIGHIETVRKYIRPEDVPSKTLVVITTDGMENASRRFNAAKIKSMVKEKQEKDGWEFIFMGANIDAVSAADNIGISEEHAVRFNSDSEGTAINYDAVCYAASAVRNSAPLDAKWKKEIEKDYKARGNK